MGIKALSTYHTQKACCRPHYKVPQNMLFTSNIVAKIHCAYSTEELCCWPYHESRHTYTEKKGYKRSLRLYLSEYYNMRLIPWHCFACTCMWLLARTFPQVGQAQWPRPRCNSFTWRLHTGLFANSLPHIPQENPPPVASICSSTKPKWDKLYSFYCEIYLVCTVSNIVRPVIQGI